MVSQGVDDSQDATTVPTGVNIAYACNEGATIAATLYQGDAPATSTPGEPPVPTGSVHVVLSDGRTFDLDQTISADGVRYANENESFVFWSKGNGAIVLENNEQNTYLGCVRIADVSEGSDLDAVYHSGGLGVTLRFPGLVASTSEGLSADYRVDESYVYQMNPDTSIYGVKFAIPTQMATGTNLSADSYFSIETIPDATTCDAGMFLDGEYTAVSLNDGDTTYSVATSSGAGAGNRYEETVFALPGINPCMAVRYFVHYGVLQNYPEGTVTEFDAAALTAAFDTIRRTIVVSR